MIDKITEWVKQGIEGSDWVLSSVTYDYDENVVPVTSLGTGSELVPSQIVEEVRLVLMCSGFRESLPPLKGSMFTDGSGKIFIIEKTELEAQIERLGMLGDRRGVIPQAPTTICRIKGSIVTQ